MEFISLIGRVFIRFLRATGQLGIFTLKALYHCCMPPFYFKKIVEQLIEIGFYSLPVVALTTFFAGAVIALQTYTGFARFSAEGAVSMVVLIAVTRELAPVMAGLMVAGRIGAAMAAELGTMRVTEQIDAIEVLKVNPIRYLFVPRVLSGILMMPPVVIIAAVVGVIAGAVTSNLTSGLGYRAFFDSAWLGIYMKDLGVCLLKSVFFGGTIALISCSSGYYASGGAKGVGEATNKAVVWSFVAIVIWDMIFAIAFFF